MTEDEQYEEDMVECSLEYDEVTWDVGPINIYEDEDRIDFERRRGNERRY